MEQNNLSLLSTTPILMGHRLQRLNENVIKSLRNGDIIFLDRYIYTALAEVLMFNVNKSHLRTLYVVYENSLLMTAINFRGDYSSHRALNLGWHRILNTLT